VNRPTTVRTVPGGTFLSLDPSTYGTAFSDQHKHNTTHNTKCCCCSLHKCMLFFFIFIDLPLPQRVHNVWGANTNTNTKDSLHHMYRTVPHNTWPTKSKSTQGKAQGTSTGGGRDFWMWFCCLLVIVSVIRAAKPE